MNRQSTPTWITTVERRLQDWPFLLHEFVLQQLFRDWREGHHVDTVDKFNVIAKPGASELCTWGWERGGGESSLGRNLPHAVVRPLSIRYKKEH